MDITYAVPLIIVTVLIAEVVTGRHKGIYDKDDLLLTVGSFVITRAVMGPLSALLMAKIFTILLPGLANSGAGTPIWLAVLLMILVGDFLFYWVHRASHKPARFPFLYKLHATHHTAKFINISVMARINVFWIFFQPYTWVSALGFYLGMIEATTIFFTGMLAWNAFTHTDFRWDDGLRHAFSWGDGLVRAIEWVFVTPRMHHTHHGYGRDGKAFKNYCTMLSCYDRLFGTLYQPQGRPEKYGIMGRNNDNTNWVEQLAYPLFRQAKKTPIDVG